MAPVVADALADPPERGGAPVPTRVAGAGRESREARFLARAVALAARDGDRDARIGDLLGLIARTSGAADAAVAVECRGRRVVIARADGEESAGGTPELATWLDTAAPRRGRGRAPLPAAFVTVTRRTGKDVPRGGVDEAHRRWIALPGRGRVTIAFAFRSARAAAVLDRRFPLSLSRPAGSIAAWLIRHREAERELADLRRADAERRRFVSVVAHELRTPLASLGGYLDLVASAQHPDVPARSAADAPPEEPTDGHVPDGEFLGRARDLVAGMATLVADLLELSRLDAGQLRLSLAPFSGTEAAQAAVRDLAPLAMERGIALETALPSRLRTVHADRRRVQQVLVNLLGNAIKFSPPSSRVALSLHFDGPVAIYTVRDHGPGVPPDERSLIFEPFHRAAGAERIVGTGLGLPIARDLTRRMGGDLDVAAVPGAGSAFVVALPALEGTAPALVAVALEEAVAQEEAARSTRAR